RFSLAPQEHKLDFAHSDWAGTLYDLHGRPWRSMRTAAMEGLIDLHYLPAGTYILRVSGWNKKSVSKKMIKLGD
ncbi:MAG: T9SS type A sorting domain-containing protein, partial [Saprospiraceae bacterium]